MIPESDLRIRLTRSEGELKLLLTAVRTDRTEPFSLGPDAERRLRDLHRALPEQLRSVHEQIAWLEPPDLDAALRQIDNALMEVRSIGNEFIDLILLQGSDYKQRWDEVLVSAFFSKADLRNEPARIDFIIEQDKERTLLTFPIEILPIMDPQGYRRLSDRITDQSQLRDALLIFPAFAAVITRRYERQLDTNLSLEARADGKIALKLIRNDGFYKHFQSPEEVSEVAWLGLQNSVFDVESPWPSQQESDVKDAGEKLATCLLDPRRLLADHMTVRRTWSDQIQHVSCHYTATSIRHVIRLRDPPDSLDINVSVLNLMIDDCKKAVPSPRAPAPLIFLNACGSGSSAGYGGLTLTELLEIKVQPRAIVATITPVDFFYAARLARAVYQGLMADLPLGQAMHEARWQLVEQERGPSPFGFFYILIGTPDLHIDKTVADA